MITVAVYCYQGMTMLDAVGPYEVFRRIEGFEVIFVGKKVGELIPDDGHIGVHVTHTMKDVQSADILIIPGSQIAFVREMQNKKLIDWIKTVHQTTKRTLVITSGTMIVASTGLLSGRKVATHWRLGEVLSDYDIFMEVNRLHDDGEFITVKGSSDAIDAAIHIVKTLQGESEAQIAQLVLGHNPSPIYDIDKFGEISEAVIEKASTQLQENAKKTISKWDFINNTKMLIKLKVK